MTTLIVWPYYLGLTLGLREAVVGLIMSIGPVISIFCGVPSGRLLDAWGGVTILISGLVAMAFGAFPYRFYQKFLALAARLPLPPF